MSGTLRDRICRLIEIGGPLSLADYMHLALAEPSCGYYATRPAIGAAGDFVTAPEISQMFGELIGLWCVDAWRKLGRPSPFCLAEAGPGRGTLIADLVRAAAIDPAFLKAARIVLVETSPAMRDLQRKALGPFALPHPPQWIDNLDRLPAMPLILVANEFLDALPLRQFVKRNNAWHEIGVGLNDRGVLGRVVLPGIADPALLPAAAAGEPEGSVFEISPAREAAIATLAGHAASHSGAVLLIDYGHLESGFGDTFQAVRDHRPADPFTDPGTADLTSHVDFAALSRAAADDGIRCILSATQGEFLVSMGLLERAGRLGAESSMETRKAISDAVERLASPRAMGELFKVLAFASPAIDLAGFPQ